jgi:hypothetical protein
LDLSFHGDLVTLVSDQGEVQTWETRPLNSAVPAEAPISRFWMVDNNTVAVRSSTDDLGEEHLDALVWREVLRLLEEPTLVETELARRRAAARQSDV